jgi:hypothetical protein
MDCRGYCTQVCVVWIGLTSSETRADQFAMTTGLEQAQVSYYEREVQTVSEMVKFIDDTSRLAFGSEPDLCDRLQRNIINSKTIPRVTRTRSKGRKHEKSYYLHDTFLRKQDRPKQPTARG